MTTPHDPNAVRSSVSDFYARAVTHGSSCCGPAPVPTGVAAQLARYGEEELSAVPDEAVANSFGCGNPLAFAEVREGDVVLDLGSGAGLDLLIAAKKVGATGRVIGVDMTDEMIAAARENVGRAGFENVEIRKGIIEELPVESGSVDWVISNCVINLSPDKPAVFREIARVLRPGGRMRVSDMVAENLPDWVRHSAELYASCVSGAVSEADYVAGLRSAGLEDVEVASLMVYDEASIRALVESELPSETSCCGGSRVKDLAGPIAEAVAGRVASITVTARKSAP